MGASSVWVPLSEASLSAAFTRSHSLVPSLLSLLSLPGLAKICGFKIKTPRVRKDHKKFRKKLQSLICFSSRKMYLKDIKGTYTVTLIHPTFREILTAMKRTQAEPKMVFETEPENFNPRFEVAGGFIRVGDEFLFVESVPKHNYGNAWGIAGGKLEAHESPIQALLREVKEETALHLDPSLLLDLGKVFVRQPDPQPDFIFHMFEYTLPQKPAIILSNEHRDFRWVTLTEALALHLIPGEAECIRMVYCS
jgi:8-oxo-dGTP pyrophosphatase MutT (NUDIX family)